MAPHPLSPASAKIKRAEIHIKDLHDAIASFLNTRPYHFSSLVNAEGTEETWFVEVRPIPDDLQSIAADALHNLRTPLDKMLAADFRNGELHADRSAIQALKFPFADGAASFRNILARQREHLTQPVIDFLADLQPYQDGKGKVLWAINQLDNRDKHRALLEPIRLGFSTADIREIKVWNGALLRLGSIKGAHLLRATNGGGNLIQENPAYRPFLRLAPASVSDYYLEFAAPYDDMEIFATTPGTRIDARVKLTLNIAFAEIHEFKGVPVVDVLKTMRDSVATVLDDFEKRFFPNRE